TPEEVVTTAEAFLKFLIKEEDE
ncbi:hypothetical protein LCGC14_3109400, partial [marine sediment metagenome]